MSYANYQCARMYAWMKKNYPEEWKKEQEYWTNKRREDKTTCECGVVVQSRNLYNHQQTKRHKDRLKTA